VRGITPGYFPTSSVLALPPKSKVPTLPSLITRATEDFGRKALAPRSRLGEVGRGVAGTTPAFPLVWMGSSRAALRADRTSRRVARGANVSTRVPLLDALIEQCQTGGGGDAEHLCRQHCPPKRRAVARWLKVGQCHQPLTPPASCARCARPASPQRFHRPRPGTGRGRRLLARCRAGRPPRQGRCRGGGRCR